MVSWQELKDYGINIYKKSSRSRVLWIGGSSSVFGLFTLLLMLTGMSYTYSGDSYIKDGIGEAYVNITSIYWRVCFDDTFEFVSTNPKVKTEVYVPAIGKNNWRLFNASKDCIERFTLSNQLPNRFKIVGYGITKTTKWSVDIDTTYTPEIDIDPLWIVTDKITKDCIPIYENQTQQIPIYKYITNENNTKKQEIIGYNQKIVKIQIECITDNYMTLDNKEYRYERNGLKCTENIDTIECDSNNGDPAIPNGICNAGESCIIINKNTLDIQTTDRFGEEVKNRWLSSKV